MFQMAGRGSFRRRGYRERDHGGRQPPFSKFTPTPPSNRLSVPPTHTTSFKRSGQTSGSSSCPSSSRTLAVIPTVVCAHCQGIGHLAKNCWLFNGQCLRCGSYDHKIATCPHSAPDRLQSSSQKSLNPSSVSQQAPASQHVLGSLTKKGAPLPSQKKAFQNHRLFGISVEKNKKNGVVITG